MARWLHPTSSRRRIGYLGLLALVLGAAVPLTAAADRPSHPSPGSWVGTWATSPQALTGTSLAGHSVRLIVHTSTAGDRVRIRLSNAFGTGPATFASVTVGRAGAGAGIDGNTATMTFGHSETVSIPAGADALSDPVALRVGAAENLAVSLYVTGTAGPSTGHADARQTSYIAAGDHTAELGDNAFTSSTTNWYWLTGVDVDATGGHSSVVAFGDSITNGANSTANANRRWPDYLAGRLAEGSHGSSMGVLNEGIDGNEVLTYRSCCGTSIPALARLDRDVIAQPAARVVVVLLGTNDIGADGASGAAVITGLQQVVAQLHAAGKQVVGGTITPDEGCAFGCYSPSAEAAREAVNAWIRDSGTFDAVADFDRALRDPADPQRLSPGYDSGDHLHPNDTGYRAMAAAVDLATLRRLAASE